MNVKKRLGMVALVAAVFVGAVAYPADALEISVPDDLPGSAGGLPISIGPAPVTVPPVTVPPTSTVPPTTVPPTTVPTVTVPPVTVPPTVPPVEPPVDPEPTVEFPGDPLTLPEAPKALPLDVQPVGMTG